MRIFERSDKAYPLELDRLAHRGDEDLARVEPVVASILAEVRAHGDRGYRYVHFEAGAMGHRLYLAAEVLGLGATGIGAFFDNEVHRYLGLVSGQEQVVYHFAIGYPVPDYRLSA